MNATLTRSTTNKQIAGVCGGIAKALDVDPNLVRVLTVILALFTQIGWIAYLVMWAVVPDDQGRTGLDDLKGGSGHSTAKTPAAAPAEYVGQNSDDLR
ncbi:MAG: PspC domain-containing protein [Propionibacteriaceae bacterium]|nr:PspC domain-containing protein [Micropruina sp.]